ncbi:MAG: hypothetical protein Q9171_003784 [Xanthocarpia ochracea]
MPPSAVASNDYVKPSLVASHDFTKSSLPRHSNNGSKRSRASSVNSPKVRLSIIEEDAASAPPMPARAHHRPFHRRWNLGDPPRRSFESPPPKYSVWDTTGPKGEKLAEMRNNKHIARRGGWRRICLILLILLTLIVGLAVGLTIGLRKKESNSQTSSQKPSESTESSSPFPAGSYTLTTYLSTVRTDCASRPTDWSCYPYHTYSQSPSEALANFTWVITSPSPSKFAISSTPNPWSVNFDSTPLTIIDENTEEERYHFETVLDKITIPSIGIQCYFNQTLLEGNLYTKKPRNYPSSSSSPAEPPSIPSSSNKEFQPWPYAIDIRQTVGGGQTIPQCFRMQDGGLGDRITAEVTPKGEEEICSCEYKNFG